jgi:ADP-ribose pyrophosphatase YjhB (NUDIX family)
MAKDACTVHKLVADVAMIAEGKVLLVRYRNPAKYDGQTGWFLPDDFLAHEEHPDAAAKRIAKEQAAFNADVRLSHVESFGNGGWHLIFHYRADLPRARPVKAAGNAGQAAWFPLDVLPPKEDVAHHGWALDNLREVLRRT